MNLGGFGNAVPMRELSPQSPNTSTSIPVSSTVTNSSFPPSHPHHLNQHLAHRPLPLSPITPSMLSADQDSANFGTGPPMSAHGPPSSASSTGVMNLMLSTSTHPGPLPMLEENVEHSGGFPISRTMTDQSLGSVFSPNSVHSAPLVHAAAAPQQQQQHINHSHQHRGRSNTMGGIPSPYEVPDTFNGNSLPHDHSRPSSARPNLQQRTNGASGGGVGGSFPPPPAHSPPPLTHSSGDLHMRVIDDHTHFLHHGGGATGGVGHHHHAHPHQHHSSNPNGNTLPRTVPNQRSFSTSGAHGHAVNEPQKLTSMRSEGNIPRDHDVMSYNTQSSNGAENTIYIQPPLDSDLELQSTSSYGGFAHDNEPIGRRPSTDRGRPLHPHQPSHHSHQPHYPGMLNGPLASSEAFNSYEGEGAIPMHMPMSHHQPSTRERGRDPPRRDSLFSETSTELSITSGSDKDTSPNGE